MSDDLTICTKRRYESEAEADDAIKHTIRLDWSPKLRSYKCRVCHHWHMTSKPTGLKNKKRKRTM